MKYIKVYTNLIISFIVIIGLNLDMNKELSLVQSLQCNSFIYVIEYLAIVYFINLIFENKLNKRLIVCTTIISLLFAVFETFGFSVTNYMNLSGIIENANTIIKALTRIFSITIIFFIIFNLTFLRINEIGNKNIEIENIKTKKKNTWIRFGIIFMLCFIMYLAYLLIYFPGMLSFDSLFQIQQGLGIYEMTSHHPIVHTFIITLCMKFGLFISNSYEVGAAIYSILQMLFMAFTFAFTITYMERKCFSKIIIIISSIFYIFYPVMGIYSITMWKDIPFALMFNFLLICIYEIIINGDSFLKSKTKIFLFILVMLLFSLFRNNGIYIIIIGMIPTIIYYKKYWKKLLVCLISVIIIFEIVNGPILKLLNIEKGSIREALSIPLQQFARVVKNEKDNLEEEEYEKIHLFIKCDDVGKYYNPILSDPVKELFDDEYFNSNKLEFISLWLKLGLKYPEQYIESFLCNTVGYWYPETVHTVVTRNIYIFENGIIIERSPITNIQLLQKYDSIIEMRNIPVISMTFSIGFFVWLFLLCIIYMIYAKQYNKLLIYIFPFALWLTVLASPVFAEYRYIFGFFTSMPLLIGIVFDKHEKI